MMTLKSVKEDLQARTLHAVSGLLGKFEYFTSLRQDDGSYCHWGLSRVYGEEAALSAVSQRRTKITYPRSCELPCATYSKTHGSPAGRMVWNSSTFCSN